MQNNSDLQGAPVEQYLGIWCVDEIIQGSEGICGSWAHVGKHMALYTREDGVVLGFTEQGFCAESYDPFWFKYCEKSNLLTGLGRDGIVLITVGFVDKKIAFRFSHANGDSFTQGGGWTGTEG